MESRVEREKRAYDNGNVFAVSDMYHKKTKVFYYPNTIYHEKLFDDLIRKKASKGKVLDIGCADGKSSEHMYKMGAKYVLGIDVSKRWIKEAKKKEIPGKLEFQRKDIIAPICGKFDLIVGRAILHHVDYERVLSMLYQNNLARGGNMVFMEPFGENILIKLFYFYAKDAQTPDEQPFFYKDFRWIVNNFPYVRFYPFNYLSLLFGVILSTLTTNIKDNKIMIIADKVDRWLGKNIDILIPRFRQFILVIENKGRPSARK